MSYFDPKIYNDEALNEENKEKMALYDLAIEDVNTAIANVELPQISPKIDELIEDLANTIFDKLIEYLKRSRLEMLVHLIDGQKEQ